MRIIFFGTPELALPSLSALAERHDVAGVVCQPDRPAGRSKKPVAPPVKKWSDEHGIDTTQPHKLNDGAFEAWLRAREPEVCALVAYGRLLKQPILDVPRFGFLNMHPSLLPKYRGPSPIQSAVLAGETLTGVTIMQIDAGMDSGDILMQKTLPIDQQDTAGSLSDKLATLGAEMMCVALESVASGNATYTPQEDTEATFTKMFKKEDGRIRWADSAVQIQNLVRAANPWPIAHCGFREKILRIHEARTVSGTATMSPGGIEQIASDGIVVATGEGRLALDVLQFPGKRALPVAEFMRGHRLTKDDRLEDI